MSQYPQSPQQPWQPADQSAPPPYAQPQYGQQGYAQPQQPHGVYQQPPFPSEKQSPVLGIVALVAVVVGCLLFGFPWSQMDLHAMSEWSIANEMLGNVPMPAEMVTPFYAIFVGAGVIFVGFILSIVATAMGRGRVYGIIGIVASIVLPWILFVIFFMLNPTLPR